MPSPHTLILGIGNILWADEGFGVRAVEHLHRHYEFPSDVKLMDGGTQGLYLVHHLEGIETLLVFDAVDYGLPPGTLKLVEGEQVPKFMGAKKMSLHQTGFQEVLATAEMLGHYPRNLLLVGVQPVQLEDYGGGLRSLTRQRIEPAIEAGLEWLAAHGVQARRRPQPLPEEASLAGTEIRPEIYEGQRPPPDVACRIGDERVLKSPAFELAYRPHPLDPDARISCDVDHRGKY
ncbi:MAG: HyaD/HybD family hydrogenase maturation endopeptidase [Gammaproteobacteria bacterium]|nr:MAG: HyaD/HybD family hydrogenase maturation endopeptidase [Gammaproteobacteria bacterium]